eukprot:SAG11_NODE_2362_length_3460_cov_2.653675_4_plen_102_part_00
MRLGGGGNITAWWCHAGSGGITVQVWGGRIHVGRWQVSADAVAELALLSASIASLPRRRTVACRELGRSDRRELAGQSLHRCGRQVVQVGKVVLSFLCDIR